VSDALKAEYDRLFETVLVPVALRLKPLIQDHLKGVPRIDRVSVRAKAPDRFLAKATKLLENGTPKYSNPLKQIQDQVGARVTVFYEGDVEVVSQELKRYFRHIEEQTFVPENEWQFGYFGKHFILALPDEAVEKPIPLERAPRFFEAQVKTLFQHAWAEAEHDLAYKPSRPLTSDQERRLAFTAAQAWGADRIFLELSRELLRDIE
jgi:putative GTP pyrophosphokinase